MNLSISESELTSYVRNQLNHFFPDKYDFVGNDVKASVSTALERCEECFKTISLNGYHDENGNAAFSHLHGDQYAAFIYFLSNSLWKYSQNRALCDKLLSLNRALYSIFISYKNDLPKHFALCHPIGTILGNAVYGDYFVVFQGVTVNTSEDADGNPAPVLGKGLFLGANSKIIGNRPIGDYVSVAANAMVYQQAIADNSVVICRNENYCSIETRKKKQCKAQSYFNVTI